MEAKDVAAVQRGIRQRTSGGSRPAEAGCRKRMGRCTRTESGGPGGTSLQHKAKSSIHQSQAGILGARVRKDARLPREIRWLSASKVWSGYRGTAGKSRHGVTNRENKHRPEARAGERRCHDRRTGQSDIRGNAPRRAAFTSLVQHRVGRA